MAIYSLLEFIDNYSMASGILWNYYWDEVYDSSNEIFANRRLNKNKTTASKSFEYKKKLIGKTPASSRKWNTKFFVPLKY